MTLRPLQNRFITVSQAFRKYFLYTLLYVRFKNRFHIRSEPFTVVAQRQPLHARYARSLQTATHPFHVRYTSDRFTIVTKPLHNGVTTAALPFAPVAGPFHRRFAPIHRRFKTASRRLHVGHTARLKTVPQPFLNRYTSDACS